MWDLNSDIPIYIQLMDIITNNIINGVYPVGEKIPSVRELALEAGVNPNTMQKALSKLEESGLIYSYRTTGKFVTEDSTIIRQRKKNLAKDILVTAVTGLEDLSFTKPEIIDLFNEYYVNASHYRKG